MRRKANKIVMAILLILLCLVLMTTSVVSGIFARFTEERKISMMLGFESFDHLRDDLIQITDDGIVGTAENRSIRIGIDRNDFFGFTHDSGVLDGAGNTAGDIQARTHRDTGLTDLMVMAYPAGIHCGTGGTDFTADGFSQVVDEFEVFL